MPNLKTVPDGPANDLATESDDVVTYSTLKVLCIQSTCFRDCLPTGGWDSAQEEDSDL